MRQDRKPENGSDDAAVKKRNVEDVFDAFFEDGKGKKPLPTPQKLEYAKTELASAAIRERTSEVFRKTQLADAELIKEIKALEKRKEIKKIPFEDKCGYFEIVRKLSSDENLAGDVYLAEKVTVKNGKECREELVVLKMMKDEEEILRGLDLADADKERLIRRMFLEAGTEIKNLETLNHPNIVSATGNVVFYNPEGEETDKKEERIKNARLVAQMEYLPHTFNFYLWSVEGEDDLTKDVLEAGMQILDAISYLEAEGLVHNDFKLRNMGVIKDGKKLVVKMLDLDSVRPIAELVSAKNETKYSSDHCDPEEFMEFHNNEVATNAKPAETIYPLGMALLYSIAERMCVPLEIRDLRVGSYAYEEEVEQVPTIRSTLIPEVGETIERTTRVSIIDPQQLRKKLEAAKEIDERNLIRVYLANERRRKALGKSSEIPSEIKKLLEKHEYVVKLYIEPEIEREINWIGIGKLLPDEMMSKKDIANHFEKLLADFKLDKAVEERCDLENDYEKLLLGIGYNIRRLTEKYAKNNYRWYTSACLHYSKKYEWNDALNNMLTEIAGLKGEDAAEVVELAKKEEKGRSVKTVFHPEVFEAIAYCLKPRAERLDAKSLKKIFEAKKIELDFPEVSREGDSG